MLTGPCALTMLGTATVAADPAAATFKKWRRVEASFLVGVVMELLLPANCPSLLSRSLGGPVFTDELSAKGLREDLARLDVMMRPYDAPSARRQQALAMR